MVLFALVKVTTAKLRRVLECVEEVYPHFHTWLEERSDSFFGMALIRKEYAAKDVQDVPPHEY